MFNKIILPVMMSAMLFSLVGCMSEVNLSRTNKQSDKIELFISAASSLTDALNDIEEAFEKEYPSINLIFNYGGSGKLAQQIEHGAPVDIFISADQSWMDQLQNVSQINQETRVDVISNQLVLISRKSIADRILSIDKINSPQISQIAIGEPNSVPAGKYAKQVLENLGQWDKVQTKLVFAKDVRQVLTYVETGNVEAGIVYISDALLSDKNVLVTEIPENLYSAIIYPASITVSSKRIEEAKQFINFLQSEASQRIFKKYGFKNVL